MTQPNLTIEELTDIRTAISEAVTNAIIHGYGNDPTQKVYMRCTAEDGAAHDLKLRIKARE